MRTPHQMTHKPSDIYMMVNNYIASDRMKEIFYYKGKKYEYRIFQDKDSNLTLNRVCSTITQRYGVTLQEKTQERIHFMPKRFLCFFLLKILKMKMTLWDVANLINNTHPSVLHHCKKSYSSLDVADKEFIQEIHAICKILGLELIVKKKAA